MKARTLYTALAMALLLNSSAYALIENGVEGERREDSSAFDLPSSDALIENGIEGEMREGTNAPYGGGSDNFYNAIITGLLWVLRA